MSRYVVYSRNFAKKEKARYIRVPVDTNKAENGLGKKTKLGGKPDWIQNDETPRCPICNNKMEFVSQLDSIDYTGNPDSFGSKYMFGDVGMIYTFLCKNCGQAKSVFQEH